MSCEVSSPEVSREDKNHHMTRDTKCPLLSSLEETKRSHVMSTQSVKLLKPQEKTKIVACHVMIFVFF